MEEPKFIFSSGPIELKEIEKDGKTHFYTEGYITTEDQDLVDDIVTKECMVDMGEQMKSRTIKLDVEHESFRGKNDFELELNKTIIPIAKIDDFVIDKKGIKILSELNTYSKRFNEVRGSLENGFLDAYSIAFIPEKYRIVNKDGKQVRMLDKIKLLNVAYTGNPINPNASITSVFAKSLDYLEEKARGEGQGDGGERQGDAGADYCYCPKCKKKIKHEKGKPCNKIKCPECGTPMEGVEQKDAGVKDERPPKEWFDRCVRAVTKKPGVSDPEALCGWIYYHKLGGKDLTFNPDHTHLKLNEDHILNKKEEQMSEEEKETIEAEKEKTTEEKMEAKGAEGKPITREEIDKVKKELEEVKAILEKPIFKSKQEVKSKEEEFSEQKAVNPLDVIA